VLIPPAILTGLRGKRSVRTLRFKIRLIFSCTFIVLVASIGSIAVKSETMYGKFTGKPLVELEDDGRKIKMMADFTYLDPKEKAGTVPKDWIVDGASIPWIFWSIVGPPLVGKYRDASFIHDYYCDTHSEPWQEVHKMFYFASLAAGESEIVAKILYAAVYVGGPRWKIVQYVGKPEPGKLYKWGGPVEDSDVVSWRPEVTIDEADKITKWISDNNPSTDEIAKRMQSYPDANEPPDALPMTEERRAIKDFQSRMHETSP
jgi:Protein of unknown function (DUF1353)